MCSTFHDLCRTGVPYGVVNLHTHHATNGRNDVSALSEFGTEQMEMITLSNLTGNATFAERVENVIRVVRNAFPNQVCKLSATEIRHQYDLTQEACGNVLEFSALTRMTKVTACSMHDAVTSYMKCMLFSSPGRCSSMQCYCQSIHSVVGDTHVAIGCCPSSNSGLIVTQNDSALPGQARSAAESRMTWHAVLQGLKPVLMSPATGRYVGDRVTLGAMGDSYYEYLLKVWLLKGKADDMYRAMWEQAMDDMIACLLFASTPSRLKYIADFDWCATWLLLACINS